MGWTYAFHNPYEPEISDDSYSSGVSPDKFQHYNSIESKKWMKDYALKKWESTLNLCVHAHGPDVELITEVARKNNNNKLLL